MMSLKQHMANPTYKVAKNLNDGKWYVYGEVRQGSQWMRYNEKENQQWMPLHGSTNSRIPGFQSKGAAEKFQKTNPPVDDRARAWPDEDSPQPHRI